MHWYTCSKYDKVYFVFINNEDPEQLFISLCRYLTDNNGPDLPLYNAQADGDFLLVAFLMF